MSPALQSRRRFLATGAALTVATAASHAIGPFSRSKTSRLRLSCAAYSFRDDFSAPKGSAPGTKPRIDMFQFIDFCAEHGCEGAELTSYYFPKGFTGDQFAQVRRHAHLRGVTVSGTAVGNNFTLPAGRDRDDDIASVKRWVDHAVLLGAPHIRVFAGDGRKAGSRPAAVKQCIEALEECADYAGKRGIVLGIENHGGIVATADELLEIVHAVRSPWIGVNLDTGNFHTDDPYGDLARCAPFAVNVQYKGEMRKKGAKQNELADMPRVMKILRDAGYQGWVALEYEMKEDPWSKVPELLKQMAAFMG